MTTPRLALVVGAAVACVCVAFLAWTPAPPPVARAEVAALTTATLVDPRPELAGRVAELERRLAVAERRLAASQEQVFQLQVFVQRLEVTPAASAGSSEAAPREAASTGVTSSTYPERPVLVQAGDDEATVRARHGVPGEVEVHRDGARTLHYWKEGFYVDFHPDGRVKEAVFLGTPTGTSLDANGNTGAFAADGRWYRPARWSIHGLTIGDPGVNVVARLGDPDSTTPDAVGLYALYYARLDAVFFISPEPDSRLTKIRLGGGAAHPDANGNVR